MTERQNGGNLQHRRKGSAHANPVATHALLARNHRRCKIDHIADMVVVSRSLGGICGGMMSVKLLLAETMDE